LSDSYPWYTPYQFAGNKPIWAIDLDGLEEFIRTSYFDVAGNLYRTEIQVIGTISGSFTQWENLQIVHETFVNVDASGNAQATYIGTTQGVFTPNNSNFAIGASTAFNAQENNAIWNITPVGGGMSNLFGVQYSDKDACIAYIRIINGGGPVPNGQAIKTDRTNPAQLYIEGILVLSNGAAPALEPDLPIGFNVTPILENDRYIIGSPGIPLPFEAKSDFHLNEDAGTGNAHVYKNATGSSWETQDSLPNNNLDDTAPVTYELPSRSDVRERSPKIRTELPKTTTVTVN
jgi:hypothetical protein